MSGFEDLGRADVDRNVREPLEQRRDVRQPLFLQEDRTRAVPGRDRAGDHLVRLGDVQAAGRLGHPAEGDVGEPGVVGEAVDVEVGDGDDLHGVPSAGVA